MQRLILEFSEICCCYSFQTLLLYRKNISIVPQNIDNSRKAGCHFKPDEFSSRMKDYYDIYYLLKKFDFDGPTFGEALKKIFANRGHTFTVEQLEQVTSFDRNDAMQMKWRAFCRKADIKPNDYGEILNTIKVFLEKPFTAVIRNEGFEGKWNACDGKWY